MKYILLSLVVSGIILYLTARAKNLTVLEYLAQLGRELKIIPGVKPGELESEIPTWEEIARREVEQFLKDLPYR